MTRKSPMKVLDLFSGIGGFSLGLERAGMETVAFCEFDEHAQKVLKKHWPDVPIHPDVSELDATQYRGAIDVVCGGFPCQDLSAAGNQKGFDGDRSSLYRQMLRIIGECGPRYAVFENVSNLLRGDDGRWFAKFLYDLAAIGYDAEWHCISASYVSAPHHRDRVWIVAYPCDYGCATSEVGQGIPAGNGSGAQGSQSASEPTGLPVSGVLSANANVQRCEGLAPFAYHLKQQIELVRSDPRIRERFYLSEPALCGADDGLSSGVDRRERLKRLGNAVVPVIPEAIGKAIIGFESQYGTDR